MKFSNAAKLKAAVKKIAIDSGVTAQGVLQKYVLERFLCRLAGSKYRNNFILKGGFLTSSLVGVANRVIGKIYIVIALRCKIYSIMTSIVEVGVFFATCS